MFVNETSSKTLTYLDPKTNSFCQMNNYENKFVNNKSEKIKFKSLLAEQYITTAIIPTGKLEVNDSIIFAEALDSKNNQYNNIMGLLSVFLTTHDNPLILEQNVETKL
jgi:hypothetical protein